MNKMNISDIQTVVCPEGYTFVKPHMRGNAIVDGYCRKTDTERKKNLEVETVEAIPFGFDGVVVYDYLKYGKHKYKEEERK